MLRGGMLEVQVLVVYEKGGALPFWCLGAIKSLVVWHLTMSSLLGRRQTDSLTNSPPRRGRVKFISSTVNAKNSRKPQEIQMMCSPWSARCLIKVVSVLCQTYLSSACLLPPKEFEPRPYPSISQFLSFSFLLSSFHSSIRPSPSHSSFKHAFLTLAHPRF